MAKKQDNEIKKIMPAVLSVVIVLIILFIIPRGPEETDINVDDVDPNEKVEAETFSWQDSYEDTAREALPDYNTFTANTNYYDYNDLRIVTATNKIASESKNPREATLRTLQFVYRNVEYVIGESDIKCFEGRAPDILASGAGQCDTQSLVVISMLRKMGIAAVPVGGCAVQKTTCGLQAFLQSITGAGPKIPPTIVTPGDVYFSRGQSSGRSGGLHAYVAAWLPGEGWVALESTAGDFADTFCWYYHVELFPANDQKEDICVSKNFGYATACANSDLERLDQYGEGLITEVEP